MSKRKSRRKRESEPRARVHYDLNEFVPWKVMKHAPYATEVLKMTPFGDKELLLSRLREIKTRPEDDRAWSVLHDWYHIGSQAFVLEPHTARMLANTAVRYSTEGGDFLPPYQAFYIHFGQYELSSGVVVVGCIAAWRMADGEPFVEIEMFDRRGDGVGRTTIGIPISGAAREDYDRHLRRGIRESGSGYGGEEDIARIVLNFPVFLSCQDIARSTSTRTHRKRQNLEDRLRRAKPNTAKWRKLKDKLMSMPPSVTVTTCWDTGLERSSSRVMELSGDREGPRRHWVRGHWRMARVGAGREQIRRTWVRPHLRGNADTSVAELRIYAGLERSA